MHLISFLLCAIFEGNPITHLRFMAVFWKFAKRRKKMKKMRDFLKAYISGTAGAICFRSGMRSLPICQHLHSKFGLVWLKDHGATSSHEIILCSSC